MKMESLVWRCPMRGGGEDLPSFPRRNNKNGSNNDCLQLFIHMMAACNINPNLSLNPKLCQPERCKNCVNKISWLWLRFPQLLSDCWTCTKIQMADCLVVCVGRPSRNLCNKDILAAGWFAPVIWVRSVRCLFWIMLGLTHELRPNRAREITFTQLTPWAPLYLGMGGGRYTKKNDIQAS